jgi:hypothetical protein
MGSEKHHKQLGQDGQYPNKYLDRASPEEKPVALPLHPIYSVTSEATYYQEEQTEHVPTRESISGCTSS